MYILCPNWGPLKIHPTQSNITNSQKKSVCLVQHQVELVKITMHNSSTKQPARMRAGNTSLGQKLPIFLDLDNVLWHAPNSQSTGKITTIPRDPKDLWFLWWLEFSEGVHSKPDGTSQGRSIHNCPPTRTSPPSALTALIPAPTSNGETLQR